VETQVAREPAPRERRDRRRADEERCLESELPHETVAAPPRGFAYPPSHPTG